VLLTVYSGTVVPVTSPELDLHAPATIPDATSVALSQMAIEGARNHGEKILAEAKEKARLETIEVETELAEGNAVETIVRKSKEIKSDMIVMGARGLGAIRKLFLGSVSEGVIKNGHCPVLIVK
jgi:nucleotide-binding universal stress UspA family protein